LDLRLGPAPFGLASDAPAGALAFEAHERSRAGVTELKQDLDAMAADELERAMTLSWRELSTIVPWGDAYDGFTAAGRQVTVERSYLWAERAGGDILCEVTVYGGPSRYDEGAKLTRLIRAAPARGPRPVRLRPQPPLR
jgi:hypothetical protein